MDNLSNKERVLAFVQEEYDGYSDVERLGEWESYDVYCANTNEDTDGDGVYVLVDEEEVRFADHDEADEIMHFFELEGDDSDWKRKTILWQGSRIC